MMGGAGGFNAGPMATNMNYGGNNLGFSGGGFAGGPGPSVESF